MIDSMQVPDIAKSILLQLYSQLYELKERREALLNREIL